MESIKSLVIEFFAPVSRGASDQGGAPVNSPGGHEYPSQWLFPSETSATARFRRLRQFNYS